MRVLQVIDSLVASGGAEMATAALAPHLAARGVRLSVLPLSAAPGLQEALTDAGAEVLAAPPAGRRAAYAGAVAAIRAVRPDLVHTTLFEADLAGRTAAARCRVPVVSSLVNASYGPEHRASVPTLRLALAQSSDVATARLVERFHAITNHVADVMARRLLVNRSRIDVIPRGRDPQVLGGRSPGRRESVRERLGLDATAPAVLVLGRQEHQKGIDLALRTAASLAIDVPDLVLLHAGREGNQTPALRELADDLSLSKTVRWLGVRRDTYDLIAAADAVLMPSRWEGLGSVAIETMGIGTPLVCSDAPALVEATGGPAYAVICRPEPAALAAGLLRVLRDRPAAQARAARARERFLAHFDIATVADATVAFYERALS